LKIQKKIEDRSIGQDPPKGSNRKGSETGKPIYYFKNFQKYYPMDENCLDPPLNRNGDTLFWSIVDFWCNTLKKEFKKNPTLTLNNNQGALRKNQKKFQSVRAHFNCKGGKGKGKKQPDPPK